MTPDSLWQTILTGYSVEKIGGEIYKLYLPTLSVLQEAKLYALTITGLEDLPTQEEVESMLPELLFQDQLDILEQYDEWIMDREVRIGMQSDFTKQEILRMEIRNLKEDYVKALRCRQEVIAASRDWMSGSIESQYCLYECVRDFGDNRLWESFDCLLDAPLTENSDVWIRFNEFQIETMDDENLRGIAKRSSYRVLFKGVVESGIPMFGTMKDMSRAAFRLCHWLQLYSSVISNSMEDVPQEVIEDDASFDRFVENMGKRRGASSVGAGASAGGSDFKMSLPIIGQ